MQVDRLFGIAVSILAFGFVVFGVPTIDTSTQETLRTDSYVVGPKFFPYLAGILCFFFGVLVAVKPQGSLPSMVDWRTPAGRRILVLATLTIGYVASIPVFGFTVSSTLMLFIFLFVFGQRRWYIILPMCGAGPAALELLFLEVFGLKLPDGLLKLSIF